MKKQIKNSVVFIFVGLFACTAFINIASANGGAVVSWNATTDDVAVTGYRVYYKTSAISCTNWNAATQTSRKADAGTLLPSTYRDVPGGTTLNYIFSSTTYLTPGTTYNFAVVAYDAAGNLSDCATGTGGVTTVSKLISYAADIDTSGTSNHKVDIYDFNLLATNFGNTTPGNAADIDRNNIVNLFDYNILFADFGNSF